MVERLEPACLAAMLGFLCKVAIGLGRLACLLTALARPCRIDEGLQPTADMVRGTRTLREKPAAAIVRGRGGVSPPISILRGTRTLRPQLDSRDSGPPSTDLPALTRHDCGYIDIRY